jgi:predicted nuclease of predicted toxin-antitoxin system
MDVHVPRAITQGLRLRGVDVITAQEDGADRFEDPDVLDRALALRCAVVTEDDDFLVEAARRQRHGIPFDGVIFGQ